MSTLHGVCLSSRTPLLPPQHFQTSPFFTFPRNWFLLFLYKIELPMRDHPSFKTDLWGSPKIGVPLSMVILQFGGDLYFSV